MTYIRFLLQVRYDKLITVSILPLYCTLVRNVRTFMQTVLYTSNVYKFFRAIGCLNFANEVGNDYHIHKIADTIKLLHTIRLALQKLIICILPYVWTVQKRKFLNSTVNGNRANNRNLIVAVLKTQYLISIFFFFSD